MRSNEDCACISRKYGSGSFDVRDQQVKFGPFVFILNKQTRFFRFVHGEMVILPSQVSDLLVLFLSKAFISAVVCTNNIHAIVIPPHDIQHMPETVCVCV